MDAQLTQQYGETIPSIAFVHIPTQAMLAFQLKALTETNSPASTTTIRCRRSLSLFD
jgi:hypothetical protein